MKVRFSKLKQNPSFFLFSFFLTVFLRIWKKGTKNSGRKRWERQEVDGQQKKRNLVNPPLKHTSKFFQLWETHSFLCFWANCLIDVFENWKLLTTFETVNKSQNNRPWNLLEKNGRSSFCGQWGHLEARQEQF